MVIITEMITLMNNFAVGVRGGLQDHLNDVDEYIVVCHYDGNIMPLGW